MTRGCIGAEGDRKVGVTLAVWWGQKQEEAILYLHLYGSQSSDLFISLCHIASFSHSADIPYCHSIYIKCVIWLSDWDIPHIYLHASPAIVFSKDPLFFVSLACHKSSKFHTHTSYSPPVCLLFSLVYNLCRSLLLLCMALQLLYMNELISD